MFGQMLGAFFIERGRGNERECYKSVGCSPSFCHSLCPKLLVECINYCTSCFSYQKLKLEYKVGKKINNEIRKSQNMTCNTFKI